MSCASKVMTSNDLIASLKRRGMVPSSGSTFTTQDYLDILNEEIDMYMLPFLLSVHEEYLSTFTEQAFTVGQDRYLIPYRAIGNKLKSVLFISADNTPYEFTRINSSQQAEFQGYFSGKNYVFYIESNEIVIMSKPLHNTTGVLRMHFYLRPNKLVENNKAAVISNIDRTGGVITVTSLPSAFVSLPQMDFIVANTPNNILDYDITPTVVNTTTNTITFTTTDIPSNLVVGDYINCAGETIVPQLPTELHALLAQKGMLTCIEAMGDEAMINQTKQKLQAMEDKLYNIIDNRVEDSPIKILNRYSPLRDVVGRYNKRNKWFIS